MKTVIDTNTLIGHILWEDSIPNQAVETAFRNSSVLRSRHTLYALEQMIMSQRFDKYLTKEVRQKFLDLFKEITEHVEIKERKCYSEDPGKNILCELACNAKAEFLISSQNEVLNLASKVAPTKVTTPSDFMQALTPANTQKG